MAKPSWITLNKSSGTGNDTIDVTAQSQASGSESRSGNILISGGELTKTINIFQKGSSGGSGDNGDASVVISMGDGTFRGDTLCQPGARIHIEVQIAGDNVTNYVYCGLVKQSVSGGKPINLAYGGINTNVQDINPIYDRRLSVGIDTYSKKVSFILDSAMVEDSGDYYIMLFNGDFSSPTDATFSSGCPITVSAAIP